MDAIELRFVVTEGQLVTLADRANARRNDKNEMFAAKAYPVQPPRRAYQEARAARAALYLAVKYNRSAISTAGSEPSIPRKS